MKVRVVSKDLLNAFAPILFFPQPPWLENGVVQCGLVLVFSVAFNFSRWFELEYKYVTIEANVTEADSAPPVLRNVTELTIQVGGGTSLHFF